MIYTFSFHKKEKQIDSLALRSMLHGLFMICPYQVTDFAFMISLDSINKIFPLSLYVSTMH